MQSVARSLVLKAAEADPTSEFLKTKDMPHGPAYTVICMDGYDHLEIIKKSALAVVTSESAAPHQRFVQVCADLGLPLAKSKKLVRGMLGPILGGEIDGELGLLIHGRDKTAKFLVKT